MKRPFIYSLALALVLVGSASWASAPRCDSIFLPSVWSENGGKPFPDDLISLQKIAHEQREAVKVSEFLMQEMRAKSQTLKSEYKNKVVELDVLCLGAGPQCAAASLVLKNTKLRSLVVEKTDLVAKTFAEKDFYINSLEASRVSMHDFPGGHGSLAHFTSQGYAHSSQLAAHIQSQQYASKVPVLLKTEIIAVKKVQEGGRTVLEVLTNAGITFRTKNLLLGTGLGEIGTKVKDAGYQKDFAHFLTSHEVQNDSLQPIMSTDAFLVSLKENRLKKQNVRVPREIILIGNGDGSRIAVEALNDKHVSLPEGFKIHWIGNNFKFAEEYVASQAGWDRYIDKIVPHYEQGRITGVPGHVEKVEVLSSGRYRVTVKDAKNNIVSQAEGDMIVDSTGYTNLNGKLLTEAVKTPELVDVVGPLKELGLTETVLARQFQEVGGEKLPIYAVGPAAGSLAKEAELVNSPNKNPVAIFNTVARTSQFVSQLLGVKALESRRGDRDERPPTKSASEIIQSLKGI